MRKSFFLLMSLFISSLISNVALAITRANLNGSTGVITIVAKDMTGNNDTDSKILFESMNVPVQDKGPLGQGKTIKLSDKSFSFICAGKGDEGHQCTVIINKSRNSLLQRDQMLFRVSGAEADAISNLLHLTPDRQFYFESIEATLAISAKPGDFFVFWKADGVR